MIEEIILVDGHDREIGTEEKNKAHRSGKLHRAFSIFVFNREKHLLLQRRNESKYHCGGLWANTCCSHPRPGEAVEQAIHRRLKEEMGFDCELKPAFRFIYKAKFDNGLIEHEYDHVFTGVWDDFPEVNPSEVTGCQWVSLSGLEEDIDRSPEKYVPWLKIIIGKYQNKLSN